MSTQPNTIKSHADSIFNRFQSIIEFDIDEVPDGNIKAKRDTLVQQLDSSYQSVFNDLFPLISFASIRITDFAGLENSARAAAQSIEDDAKNTIDSLNNIKLDADSILSEIREVAAEQGVSQQSIYFKNEADKHEELSNDWKKYTFISAACLFIYSIIAATTHKWTFLAPENQYEAIQFIFSKILIFVVIAYILILCARNFLSHKHNEIVNRHRQNALSTFKTLADASNSPEKRDVVLTHAASSIFMPQESGYAKGNQFSNSPMIEILQRIASDGSSGS